MTPTPSRNTLRTALAAGVLLSIIAAGCGGRTEELEKQNAALQQQNRDLAKNMTAQDEYIDDVVTAVNEVYQNMEAVRASEKNLLTESKGIEGAKGKTKDEVRQDLLKRIDDVNANLQDNYKKVDDLQKKVSSSRKQYAALQTMVENLRKTIEERELSIAELENRVKGLEGEVATRTEQVRQRDVVIEAQKKEMATVYYVVGTKKELEEKGIVKDEGGFLWGLVGTTTTLAPNFDLSYFTPIDKGKQNIFRLDKRVREIVPKRSVEYYTQVRDESGITTLTIADRDRFWKDRFLVILTD